MGLKIHAETPEEIAVSILAEIIQIRHGSKIHESAAKSMSLHKVDSRLYRSKLQVLICGELHVA